MAFDGSREAPPEVNFSPTGGGDADPKSFGAYVGETTMTPGGPLATGSGEAYTGAGKGRVDMGGDPAIRTDFTEMRSATEVAADRGEPVAGDTQSREAVASDGAVTALDALAARLKGFSRPVPAAETTTEVPAADAGISAGQVQTSERVGTGTTNGPEVVFDDSSTDESSGDVANPNLPAVPELSHLDTPARTTPEGETAGAQAATGAATEAPAEGRTPPTSEAGTFPEVETAPADEAPVDVSTETDAPAETTVPTDRVPEAQEPYTEAPGQPEHTTGKAEAPERPAEQPDGPVDQSGRQLAEDAGSDIPAEPVGNTDANGTENTEQYQEGEPATPETFGPGQTAETAADAPAEPAVNTAEAAAAEDVEWEVVEPTTVGQDIEAGPESEIVDAEIVEDTSETRGAPTELDPYLGPVEEAELVGDNEGRDGTSEGQEYAEGAEYVEPPEGFGAGDTASEILDLIAEKMRTLADEGKTREATFEEELARAREQVREAEEDGLIPDIAEVAAEEAARTAAEAEAEAAAAAVEAARLAAAAAAEVPPATEQPDTPPEAEASADAGEPTAEDGEPSAEATDDPDEELLGPEGESKLDGLPDAMKDLVRSLVREHGLDIDDALETVADALEKMDLDEIGNPQESGEVKALKEMWAEQQRGGVPVGWAEPAVGRHPVARKAGKAAAAVGRLLAGTGKVLGMTLGSELVGSGAALTQKITVRSAPELMKKGMFGLGNTYRVMVGNGSRVSTVEVRAKSADAAKKQIEGYGLSRARIRAGKKLN